MPRAAAGDGGDEGGAVAAGGSEPQPQGGHPPELLGGVDDHRALLCQPRGDQLALADDGARVRLRHAAPARRAAEQQHREQHVGSPGLRGRGGELVGVAHRLHDAADHARRRASDGGADRAGEAEDGAVAERVAEVDAEALAVHRPEGGAGQAAALAEDRDRPGDHARRHGLGDRADALVERGEADAVRPDDLDVAPVRDAPQRRVARATLVGAELAEAVRHDHDARAPAGHQRLALEHGLVGVREHDADVGVARHGVERGQAGPAEQLLVARVDEPDRVAVAVLRQAVEQPGRPRDAPLRRADDRDARHQALRLDAIGPGRRAAAQGCALRRVELVEQPVELRPRLRVAAGQVDDRPVAAPHQPIGAERLQRVVQERPDVVGSPVREVGPGGEQPGHLGQHVGVGGRGAQVPLPARDPRLVAADGRLREVVDDHDQVGMALGEDRHELQVAPAHRHDVERDAARLEQRQALADVRSQQPLDVRLEVDGAAYAPERRVPLDLLEAPRRVGGPVERQPARRRRRWRARRPRPRACSRCPRRSRPTARPPSGRSPPRRAAGRARRTPSAG